MNPYQGLKLNPVNSTNRFERGSNQHESLSGIETAYPLQKIEIWEQVLINMNPYQGLKQVQFSGLGHVGLSSNQHESLSGIETSIRPRQT